LINPHHGVSDAKTSSDEINLPVCPTVEGLKRDAAGRKGIAIRHTDRAKVDWQDWLDSSAPTA